MAVRATLRESGREDTADGAAAVFAARTAEAGGNTGSAVAALLKELRAAVDAATKGAVPAFDAVDELRKRRDGKRTG